MHVNEHVNVQELAKGYFPPAVPGRSEDNKNIMTNRNNKYNQLIE